MATYQCEFCKKTAEYTGTIRSPHDHMDSLVAVCHDHRYKVHEGTLQYGLERVNK